MGFCTPVDEAVSAFGQPLELSAVNPKQIGLAVRRMRTCGRASSLIEVVLHLRSRYVSKARDFAGSGTFRGGRKSKSRLNSKGLAAWRRIVATVFPLRI
jgi:hypothetical protein